MCKSWVADDTGEMLKGEFAGMRFEQGDLRTIKGTRMAFTQTTYLNGKKSRMSTVKDVRINEPVEDSVFNPDLITVAKGTGKPAAMAAWFHPLDDLKGAQETSNEEQRQTGDIKLPEPAAPQQETREDTSFKKEVKNELKKEAGKQLIKGFLGAVLK
jgi:hypothetical protein